MTPHPFSLPFFAAVLMAAPACSGKEPASPAPIPLPLVKLDEVPAPAAEIVVFERGMEIAGISQTAYGSSDLKHLVLAYNDLKETDPIPAGRKLKTPSIARMFQAAGADARYQPAFNVLGKVLADLNTAMPAYLQERRSQGTKPTTGFESARIVLKPETAKELERLALAVDACCEDLGKVVPPHQVPHFSIGQLKQCAAGLHGLAAGGIEENSYDVSLVYQRLGRGLGNAMLWVKAGHR